MNLTPKSNAPPPAWLPYDGRGIRNGPDARNAMAYLQVVRQFDVMQNPRYQPRQRADTGKLDTFCKTLVWDITRAMMAEIPHWVDAVGDPAPPGRGNTETTANTIHTWLKGAPGARAGWYEVDRNEACILAETGHPVVATWLNPSGGHGHMGMVVPPCFDDVMIAQAGARNAERSPLEKCFPALRPVLFFAHP